MKKNPPDAFPSFRDELLAFSRTRDTRDFLQSFEGQPERLAQLMHEVLTLAPYPCKEYGSWAILHLAKKGFAPLSNYYESLVDLCFRTTNQTVLRNVIASLNHLEMTSYREAEFMDLLLEFIRNAHNKVALQVYSIYQLIPFVEKYPELLPEISQHIERHAQGKSAAYQVALRNFRKKFSKSYSI